MRTAVDINTDEHYKLYKLNSSLKNKLNKKDFSNVIKEYHKIYSKIILEKSGEIKMKYLGNIRIYEYKPVLVDKNGKLRKKALTPDWKKTLAYWKELYPDKTKKEIKEIKDKPLIYLENKHTDGKSYKWYWDRLRSRVKGLIFYRFKATRDNKRNLSNCLKSKDKKYYYYG